VGSTEGWYEGDSDGAVEGRVEGSTGGPNEGDSDGAVEAGFWKEGAIVEGGKDGGGEDRWLSSG
jgi:hypothetical protein